MARVGFLSCFQLFMVGPKIPGFFRPGFWVLRNPGIFDPGFVHVVVAIPGIRFLHVFKRNPGIRNPGIRNPGIRNPGIFDPGFWRWRV
jgi:hypothetical protein